MTLKKIALVAGLMQVVLIILDLVNGAAYNINRNFEIALLVIHILLLLITIRFLQMAHRKYRRHQHFKIFLATGINGIIFFVGALIRYSIIIVALSSNTGLNNLNILTVTFLALFGLYIIILISFSLANLILFTLSYYFLDQKFLKKKAKAKTKKAI